MTGIEVHDALADLLALLGRLTMEHKRLCRAAQADKVALGAARWKIATAGRQRMELLAETVFPLLERRCAEPALGEVRALRLASVAYRQHISDYVARWSTAAILSDWPTYVREASAFRQLVSGHVAEERRLLLPLLRGLGGERATADRDGGPDAGRQFAMLAPAGAAVPPA